MKRFFKRCCLWLHYKMDPNLIDFCYFNLRNETLTELVGDISSKLYDWGI